MIPSRSTPATASSITCSSSWPGTAASPCRCTARAICISTSTTPSRTARWRWARAAQALGDKGGIARYGFLLPMDEAEAQVAIDLSGRACVRVRGSSPASRSVALPTELVPHFFRSLGDTLGAAIHVSVHGRKHPSHGRGLLQGRGPRAAPGPASRRQRAAVHQGSAVSVRRCRGHRQRRRQPGLAGVCTGAPGCSQHGQHRSGPSAAHRTCLLPGVGSAPDAMSRLRELRSDRRAFRSCSSRCWASASECSCCSSLANSAEGR